MNFLRLNERTQPNANYWMAITKTATARQTALNEWKAALDVSAATGVLADSLASGVVDMSFEFDSVNDVFTFESVNDSLSLVSSVATEPCLLQPLTNIFACSARFCGFPSYMTRQFWYSDADSIVWNGAMHAEDEQILCRSSAGSFKAWLILFTDIDIPPEHVDRNSPFVSWLIPICATLSLHIVWPSFVILVDWVFMSLLLLIELIDVFDGGFVVVLGW